MDDLHNLNPQYMHDIVPGASQEYILRIPYQFTPAYIEHEDSLYTYMADSLFKPATLKAIESGRAAGSGRITYKVKSGDYLGRIASRYHVSINQIKQWNHLRSNNLAGRTDPVYLRPRQRAGSPGVQHDQIRQIFQILRFNQFLRLYRQRLHRLYGQERRFPLQDCSQVSGRVRTGYHETQRNLFQHPRRPEDQNSQSIANRASGYVDKRSQACSRERFQVHL